jgi:hypothetical protein
VVLNQNYEIEDGCSFNAAAAWTGEMVFDSGNTNIQVVREEGNIFKQVDLWELQYNKQQGFFNVRQTS